MTQVLQYDMRTLQYNFRPHMLSNQLWFSKSLELLDFWQLTRLRSIGDRKLYVRHTCQTATLCSEFEILRVQHVSINFLHRLQGNFLSFLPPSRILKKSEIFGPEPSCIWYAAYLVKQSVVLIWFQIFCLVELWRDYHVTVHEYISWVI